MKKGQTSVTDGIQNFLCPFTEMRITQVENVASHKGTKAIDVAAKKAGTKAAYYTPADSVCVAVVPEYGESRWQTQNKVRCANGYIGYVTYEVAHDDSFNAYVGMKLKQGEQLGNMGTKSPLDNVTGVHCHIQFSQSKTTSFTKNKYGVYGFPTEAYCDDVMFIDGTTIVDTGQAKWKNAPKESTNNSTSNSKNKTLYLPKTADSWRVYPTNKDPVVGNECGFLYPSKFGGLTYEVLATPQTDVVTIQTRDYGKVNIYVAKSTGAVIK